MENGQRTDNVSEASSGDRRGRDRRKGDRRNDERRGPIPLWRRPVAYVSYGVLGALALFLVLRSGDDDGPGSGAVSVENTALSAEPEVRATAPAATREAFTVAQYEGLIAEGENAVGDIVRTELVCGSITAIATRDVEGPNETLASLTDQNGRVAGAACSWSREDRSGDFLLIIPPELAVEFARAPEVELNFVRRRIIPADVEWLGRSESLSLRTAGILRAIR